MPHPVPTRHLRSAFTLIELLTVIAIIGILAAILIPTVSKVRQTAKNAQCASLVREWGRIIILYANENKGNYTVENWASAQKGEGPYRDYFTKSDAESKNMRTCPMHPDAGKGLTQPPLTYALVRGHKGDGSPGNAISLYLKDKIPLGKAKTPSRYLLLVDAVANSNVEFTGNTVAQSNLLVAPLCNPSISVAPTGPNISDTIEGAKRHGGTKVNAVFGDGSVKRIGFTPAMPGDPNSLFAQRLVWFRID